MRQTLRMLALTLVFCVTDELLCLVGGYSSIPWLLMHVTSRTELDHSSLARSLLPSGFCRVLCNIVVIHSSNHQHLGTFTALVGFTLVVLLSTISGSIRLRGPPLAIRYYSRVFRSTTLPSFSYDCSGRAPPCVICFRIRL